jgi:predicted RNA-binding protein associated with RNAse of E/G family
MPKPLLYRRRYIPNELIYLKDDIILLNEDDLIITKWVTLHPHKDIASGISAFYIDKGYKISKIYDKNNHVVYWYCDIIQTKKDPNKNTVIFEDLLIDVILYEDGTIHILDLDELSDALDSQLITQAEATYALRTLDSLLHLIYQGDCCILKEPVNRAEKNYSSSSI